MTFSKSNQTSLVVSSSRFPPFSTDPLDIDAMVHHIAFSSVYSTLVSNYKKGELKGIIAESWEHSQDFKRWTFKIRKGLTFESGAPISASVVHQNFLRIAYKMKLARSESGFVEFLTGIDRMLSASDSISGIQLVDQGIQFEFIKPFPRLVSLISFGLYSIVEPEMFDSKTGDWLNPKAVNSSGAYRLESSDQHSIRLSLRSDYPPTLMHPNAFHSIEIVPNNRPRSDGPPHIAIGFSDQKMANNFSFLGPVNSVIRHLRCYHWDNPNHFFYKKETRAALRDLLFKRMEESGYTISR